MIRVEGTEMDTGADRTVSGSEALQYGWTGMLRDFSLFVGIGLLGAALAIVGAQVGTPSIDRPHVGVGIASVLIQLGQVLIGFVWIRLALSLRDGERPAPSDALPSTPRFLSFLLATVLYGLAVAVGLALLVLPGVVIAARLGFYGFVMAEEPLSPVAALRRSFEVTRGATVDLVLFGFLLLVVNVFGALALGVGLFATIPTSALAAAFVYRRLSPRAEAPGAALKVAS